jgi:hypothetical protein
MALRTDGAEEIISDKSTSHEGIDDVSKTPPATGNPNIKTDPSIEGLSDAAALPKGTLDPVYEAKARVLNHAVGTSGRVTREILMEETDPRNWNGLVSMAALHRRGFRLGKRQSMANCDLAHPSVILNPFVISTNVLQ